MLLALAFAVVIGGLFKTLYDGGAVSALGVQAWREDKKDKTKGKVPALVKLGTTWLDSVRACIAVCCVLTHPPADCFAHLLPAQPAHPAYRLVLLSGCGHAG
jgi:hypothetical protein